MLASPGCAIDQVLHGDFSEASGTEAARTLLARGPLPQAVVCANDQMAIGVLREFQREGVTVPADVALTGFDDVYPSRLVDPPLTTVSQPLRELGVRATQRLLARIEDRALPPRTSVLPTRVMIRASCGCPGNRQSLAKGGIPPQAGAGTHRYNGTGCAASWGTGEVERNTNSIANVSEDGSGHLSITPVNSGGSWTSGRIETVADNFAAPAGGEMEVSASIKQPNPGSGLGYWPALPFAGGLFPGPVPIPWLTTREDAMTELRFGVVSAL